MPLFFSISGYFFYKGDPDAECGSIPRKVKNLAVLLLISELTYLSFYTFLQMRHVGISLQAVKNVVEAEVLNYYCLELADRLAVFAPPFNGIGWFIGSLIMVYLVILSVVRRKWFPIFLICTLALLPVGVLIRRIFIMMDLKTLLPDERILPLLPLPFFAMGYLMHRHQEQCLSVGDRFCLVVFAAGTVLTLAENCFQTHTLYIGTVLMVPSILLLCVKHGEHVPKSWFGCMMSHIGSITATYIYLFHILVETVLRVMIDGVLPGIRENSLFAMAYPLIVFAASAVFGEMIFRVKLLGKHLNTKT